MNWKTDRELFADIDENGKLFEDEFTRMMSDETNADSIPSSYYHEIPVDKGFNTELRGFEDVSECIRSYVQKRAVIGKFPSKEYTVRVCEYEIVDIYSANEDYNEELDNRLREIDNWKDDARNELIDFSNALGSETTGVANHYIDKIEKEAAYARNQALREAEASGMGSDTDSEVYTGIRRVIVNSYERKYNFFDEISKCWKKYAEVFKVQEKRDMEKLARIVCFIHVLLWPCFLYSLLLAANIVCGWENSVSMFLSGKYSDDMLLAVLCMVSSVLLLILMVTATYDITFFTYIDVPAPVLGYFLIFGICTGAGATLEEVGKRAEDISRIAIFGTAAFIVIYLFIKNEYFSWFWELVKTVFVLFCGMAVSMLFIAPIYDKPVINIIKEKDVVTFSLTSTQLIFGLLAIACIVNIIINLVLAHIHRKEAKALNNELQAVVERYALTDYKVLRFIWLWINNSQVEDKQKYFEAVEQEIKDLGETILQAKADREKKGKRLTLR